MADENDKKNERIEAEQLEGKNDSELKSICEGIRSNKHPQSEQSWAEYADNNQISMGNDAKSYRAYIDAYNKWHDSKKDENESGGNGNGEKGQEKGNDQNAGDEKGKGGEENKNEDSKGDNNVEVTENAHKKSDENTNKDFIEQERQSWKAWCEDETIHNPKYIYDEQESTGLKFDVYKTQADKEAGNIAASIEYTGERKVNIETEEGKIPDYEFFAKLAKDAKNISKVPGITFKGDMTPEFKSKLAAACLENKLDMVGGPDFIDVNLLGNVSEDLKKKIDEYNKTKNYEKKYNLLVTPKKAEIDKIKEKEPDKPVVVHLNDKIDPKESPEFAAIAYAAYVNAGAKVDGLDQMPQFKNSHGAIQTPDLKYFPEKAIESIKSHNKDVYASQYDAKIKSAEKAADDFKTKNPGGTFKVDLSKEVSPETTTEDIGLTYAAYVKAGAVVEGMDNIPQLQKTRGMILSKDKDILPEDAEKTIRGYNDKRSGNLVASVRKLREDRMNKALNDPNTSEENKKKILDAQAERGNVEQARDVIRDKKKEGKEVTKEDREALGANRGLAKGNLNIALLKSLGKGPRE